MTKWKAEPAPSARRAAYGALFDIFEKEAYANLTIQHLLARYAWRPEERRFLTELVYGVCRRYNVLLWLIGRLSTRPVGKLDAPVRLLLCLGLYQLAFLDAVPDSAAVNETVKLAKKITHAGSAGFINAVLRNFIRRRDSLRILGEEADPILHDALTYNEPEWLVRRWTAEWGPDKARAVLAALNRIPAVDIRCNRLKTDRGSLMQRLSGLGAAPEPIALCADGITLGESGPFFRSGLLKEGLAYVQNRASMAPACILAPEAGETVLDMCAAPGSKTTQIAALMDDRGQVDAWDIYPHKIRLIWDNCRRMGIHIVRAEVRDASAFHEEKQGRYDRVLLDAPCSGLGVLGRKTEMRWRRKEEDLAAFPPLQKQMLHRAASYVKPGGRIVYSTCTLNGAENEAVVETFLAAHPDFVLTPFSLPGADGMQGMCTLWPDIHESDGFFAACLTRRA